MWHIALWDCCTHDVKVKSWILAKLLCSSACYLKPQLCSYPAGLVTCQTKNPSGLVFKTGQLHNLRWSTWRERKRERDLEWRCKECGCVDALCVLVFDCLGEESKGENKKLIKWPCVSVCVYGLSFNAVTQAAAQSVHATKHYFPAWMNKTTVLHYTSVVVLIFAIWLWI